MKKLLLILSLTVIGLSGCYVRGHDDGYRRDRDHREDNHQSGHDDHKNDRGEEHGDRDR